MSRRGSIGNLCQVGNPDQRGDYKEWKFRSRIPEGFYHRREGIDDRMLKNLCQNPALPIEVLEEIIKSGQGFRVSNHPRMTPELRTLFDSLSESDQLEPFS